MIRKLFSVVTGGAKDAPANVHQVFRDGVFSLDAPAIFTRNDNYGMFQLVSDASKECIFVAKYYYHSRALRGSSESIHHNTGVHSIRSSGNSAGVKLRVVEIIGRSLNGSGLNEV